MTGFQNRFIKNKSIQHIHTYLSNSLSVVMVNVFATGEVERGLDSIFPVRSNLGLKNMTFISSLARVVNGSCYGVRIV